MNQEVFDKFILKVMSTYNCSNDDNLKEIMKNCISDAQNLADYGELRIALENLLENILEYELYLDDKQIELAESAFGKNITDYDRKLLELLKKRALT